MKTIETKKNKLKLDGDFQNFDISFSSYEEEPGLEYIILKLHAAVEEVPKEMHISWIYPDIDIHTKWTPSIGFNRGVNPDWYGPSYSKATFGAPVEVLLNYNNENKLTVAFSDALSPVKIKTGVNEETGNLICDVALFSEESSPIKSYEGILRLDTRAIPYYESLNSVQKWWASMSGYEPSFVPDTAKLPMYSTWYSFHQNVIPSEIVKQCTLAKAIGCETVIVDDGWQTEDNNRGYAYCGDWETAKAKIPDMKEFVDEVHNTGLKFMIWYSVPFVGKHSKAWERFKGKFLDSENNDWCVLDPRYPEVREYLINIYEEATRNWGLDGLKLDFVDSFNITPHSQKPCSEGQDCSSLSKAVDRLLKDTLSRLKAIKPDFMIEFRQSYIGPVMRTYGNMFRAGDCPNDSLNNRVRTLDVRLICGNTATHSDMLMWNYNDTVESAALQVINILYSVPQISMMIDKLSKQHYEMLKFWMDFWVENRDVLLDGEFAAMHPEANYTSVISATDKKIIATAYANTVMPLKDIISKEIILVNGTLSKNILLEIPNDIPSINIKVMDCCGNTVRTSVTGLIKGINVIEVPPAGIVYLGA